MTKIQLEIKKLNRKILSQIETELNVLKEQCPSVSNEIDNMFKRLRKNVLDTIGDCERSVGEE